MAGGVEAERTATGDTTIGLLPYTQDLNRASWASHTAQHELEAKALDLALARVADGTAALDKALLLAVTGEASARTALREILLGRIDALQEATNLRANAIDTRFDAALQHVQASASLRSDHDKEQAVLARTAIRDLLTARLDAMDKALALRTAEIERHLNALNGEQARLLQDRERYQEKSVASEKEKGDQVWRDQVNKFMATNQARDNTVYESRVQSNWNTTTIVAVAGVMAVVIGIAIKFIP